MVEDHSDNKRRNLKKGKSITFRNKNSVLFIYSNKFDVGLQNY